MNLDECRQKIDRIDEGIVALLSERAAAAREIGLLKAKAGLPVTDRGREIEIVDRVSRRSESAIGGDVVVRIYGEILLESRRIQNEVIAQLNAEAIR